MWLGAIIEHAVVFNGIMGKTHGPTAARAGSQSSPPSTRSVPARPSHQNVIANGPSGHGRVTQKRPHLPLAIRVRARASARLPLGGLLRTAGVLHPADPGPVAKAIACRRGFAGEGFQL
jgi:hypothetical protein